MLLELAQWVAKDVRLFNVFNYITLRAVLACLTALAVSLILGPYVIRKLTAYKIGQAVREEGPRSHLTKAGTPTMGGALILVSMCLTVLLWGDLSNRLVWVVLLVTLAFGTIGWVDDYRKVVHRNPRGLPARWKFFWQALIGMSAAIYLGWLTQSMPALNQLIVPFFKHIAYPLGMIGFIVLTFFVIVGTSNAVNLTDGLDGLAIMPTIIAASTFAILCYVAGSLTRIADVEVVGGVTRLVGVPLWRYLGVPEVPGGAELAVFCASIVGAGISFLWFNAYPASVFMGDIGSLALGGALGGLAVLSKNEVVSAIIHGVFFAEILSVMIQVTSFKLTGKRVFKMAPVHHHFELKGMAEPKIIVRFWIVAILCGGVALLSLKLR